MAETSNPTDETSGLWEKLPDHVGYRVCRESITALLQRRPDAADLPVPACPGWTVRDLAAHLLNICESARNSLIGLPEPLSGPDDRRGVPELLDEWTRVGLETEKLVAESELWHGPLSMDVFAHEVDIRNVLGEEVPADHPAYPGAMGVVFGGFAGSVRARGLPALLIETAGQRWVVGGGEPVATLRAHRHDLFRSVGGRRTHQQIAELAWTGPHEQWLPAFTWGPFDPPKQAVEKVIGATR
jgi:uncharacterized protein (TIGR03083 family)